MKVLSTQVGIPKKHEWQGRSIETSMFKTAAEVLKVSMTSIQGDRFANPNYHGTPDSVFYAMSKNTYEQMQELLGKDLEIGSLGENATFDDLDENKIEAGDVFQIGSVQVQATSPRIPCEKLNFVTRHVDAQMAFVKIQKPGVYFKIIKTGEIRSGDELKLLTKAGSGISIGEMYKLITDLRMFKKCEQPSRLFHLIESPFVPDQLKDSLKKHAAILKINKL